MFPGEHQRATFRVIEDERRFALHTRSVDGRIEIDVVGRRCTYER